MPPKARKGGLPVGRLPTRPQQNNPPPPSVIPPAGSLEDEDPVFPSDPGGSPRKSQRHRHPIPSQSSTHTIHPSFTGSSNLTTAPSTRMSRTPRRTKGIQISVHAHSPASKKATTPTSRRNNPPRNARTPSQVSHHPGTSRGGATPKRKKSAPYTPSRNKPKSIGSAFKNASTSHPTAPESSRAIRRTPRRHKTGLSQISPPVAQVQPGMANNLTRELNRLPGRHLTLDEHDEIVPETPGVVMHQGMEERQVDNPTHPNAKSKAKKILMAYEPETPDMPRQKDKGKGRVGPPPQWPTNNDAPEPMDIDLPQQNMVAQPVAASLGHRKSKKNVIVSSDPDDDTDDGDRSYAGEGSYTALSPYHPGTGDSSFYIGAQPQTPYGNARHFTPGDEPSSPSSNNKRKRAASGYQGIESDRPATRKRIEKTNETQLYASIRGVAKRSVASGPAPLSQSQVDPRGNNAGPSRQTNAQTGSRFQRGAHDEQPSVTDLLKERATPFQRVLPKPETLRRTAALMQPGEPAPSKQGPSGLRPERLEHHERAVTPADGDSTEGEEEAEANTSDDEPQPPPHAQQAIVRRMRRRREGDIPRHHMGYYTPNTRAVLRAGKVFIAQLILSHNAYPHDSMRQDMGRSAWNYAKEVEATHYGQASIKDIDSHIQRLFGDHHWKTRGDVKKGASLAIGHCYSLPIAEVAHNPTARESVKSRVAALLDRHRFLWFIPTPHDEDENEPLPEDDIRRKASFYHPAVPWTITLAFFKNATEAQRQIYTPMPLEVLALAGAAIHCALSEYRTGYHRVVQFSEASYRELYREYYWELHRFSTKKPNRFKNLCCDTSMACIEFTRGEPASMDDISQERNTDPNQIFQLDTTSDDEDGYAHLAVQQPRALRRS